MSDEPDSIILRLLRDMRAEMATKSDIADMRAETEQRWADLRSEVRSLRADAASDIAMLQSEDKKTREQIVGLRRAVMEYHSSVVGHGILISDLEARVRRVEQHLDLPALDTH